MTSSEDIPSASAMALATSPGGSREWLSQEDTILLRSLCQAMRNADFKKSKENPWVTADLPSVPTSPQMSQAENDKELSQQAEGRAADSPSPRDLNVPSDTTDDKEVSHVELGGITRMATLALEAEKPVNDTNDVPDSGHENEEKRPVAEQAFAALHAYEVVTNRYDKLIELLAPVLDVKTEKDKTDEVDIYHELYKRFKNVNDKLPLLENAISRLGGVGDVLSGIRQLRAALIIALRWDKDVFPDKGWTEFRRDVKTGKLNSLEKILEEVRDWPDLKEDGTVFGTGTYPNGDLITPLMDLKLLLGRVSESVRAMEDAFNELGTVNGCQFVSLCATLRAVRIETRNILLWIKRFALAPEHHRALNLVRSKFGGLNDSMKPLSDDIMNSIDRDISNLRNAEQRVTDKYNSLTVTATFFSGLTATAIQISAPMTGSTLKDAVNTVWFTSLVFSVGSVIASLVGLSWLQSRIPVRIKEGKFKRGVIFFLRNGPTMLMTAAAVTFMIGLALFVNASSQARSTSIVASFFIAFISVILIFLAICFGLLYEGNMLPWSQSRLKAARIAFLQLRHKIVRVVSFPGQESMEDTAREFLDEPDSDAVHTLSSPSKIQVNLCKFDGPLAVVNSETSSLAIYKNYEDSSPVNITAANSLGEVKQLLWAPDNIRLLIRTSNTLSIWSQEESVCKALFERPGPIQDAIWTDDSKTILVIEPKSLTFISVNTTEASKTLPLRGIQVVTAQFLNESNDGHLVCIADVTEEDNALAVRKLLVIDHSTGNTIYSGARIKTTTSSLQISAEGNLTKGLLSFTDGSDPQLWGIEHQNLTSWEVKPMLKYDVRGNPCRSPAYFSGHTNELVVCALDWEGNYSRASDIWVWSTYDATRIHIIYIYELHSGLPSHITWKVDDSWTLALAAAYDDGEVVNGKISLFDPTNYYGNLVVAESNVKVLKM